jgi:hypothetical protein
MVYCCISVIGYATVAVIVVKIAYILYRVVYAFFYAEQIKDLIEYSGGKWAGRGGDGVNE